MNVLKYIPFIRTLMLGMLFAFMMCEPADAYIGPGAGFAVIGSFFVMFIAIIAAIITLLTWPVRWLFRAARSKRALKKCKIKRFIVVGLDGMDPELSEKYMNAGKLPNFSKLRDNGFFHRLATTIPPISPVAWSSFQTGSNPGKHSIFDFLTRDKRTYLPELSSVEIKKPSKILELGKYIIPLAQPTIRLLRRSKPFWYYLGKNGIFSSIIRVPITFPPEKFKGVLLSGMCVPDLKGSQGTFSFFTTQPNDSAAYTGGERVVVKREGDIIKSALVGPVSPVHKKRTELTCPFEITLPKNGDDHAQVNICGKKYLLKKDEYTEWIPIVFKAGFGIKIKGICQFLLLKTNPDFELYVTPIHIDPEKPALPVTYPAIYSSYLAKNQGKFATLGLAEDTWALNEKILDDDSFLEQCIQGDKEREAMLFDTINKVQHGGIVCVFDGTDRVQHTFWRYSDDKHPVNVQSDRNIIEEHYQRMDTMIGKVVDRCDKDTILMVISDHGFKTFRYGIDLNRWLEENGYLTVKPGGRGEQYLQGIDWSQTKAYAIGLTGIFLNIKGREKDGIVEPGEEADNLCGDIAEKLETLKDTKRDALAMKRIYRSADIYTGPFKGAGPDLIVGYDLGYRASWETAVGRVTEQVFHDNTKAWSGDHCIDSSLVPGVLFCNRQVDAGNPRLMDIGPTILDMFGVDVPKHMDGKPLGIK